MDQLIIAGRSFSSRLMVGTGKFASNEAMVAAMEGAGSEIVTADPQSLAGGAASGRSDDARWGGGCGLRCVPVQPQETIGQSFVAAREGLREERGRATAFQSAT